MNCTVMLLQLRTLEIRKPPKCLFAFLCFFFLFCSLYPYHWYAPWKNLPVFSVCYFRVVLWDLAKFCKLLSQYDCTFFVWSHIIYVLCFQVRLANYKSKQWILHTGGENWWHARQNWRIEVPSKHVNVSAGQTNVVYAWYLELHALSSKKTPPIFNSLISSAGSLRITIKGVVLLSEDKKHSHFQFQDPCNIL